jgi:hypothetical protein
MLTYKITQIEFDFDYDEDITRYQAYHTNDVLKDKYLNSEWTVENEEVDIAKLITDECGFLIGHIDYKLID